MLVSTTPEAQAQTQKPNVLLIIVDDLGPMLRCYGDSKAITPHIDELAAKGILFRDHYCQTAICAPSRQSMLTGLRPDRIGTYDLDDRFREKMPGSLTLPEYFKKEGYRTLSLGKVFHNGTNDQQSWSEPAWWPVYPFHEYINQEALGVLKKEKRRLAKIDKAYIPENLPGNLTSWGKKRESWQSADIADEYLADGKIARKATAVLREAGEQPFFLAVGFLKPHLPLVAPQKYFDQHPREKFVRPATSSFPRGSPTIASTGSKELRGFTDILTQGELTAEKKIELIRAYYACVSFVDAQIGKIIQALKTNNLEKNTIIVLWGDHGFSLGENDLWGKRTNFEAATHSPLIMVAPQGKFSGRVVKKLVESVDIFPTLCSLAGLSPPHGLAGEDLIPQIQKKKEGKKAVFSQISRGIHPSGPHENISAMGYSVRTKRYRYTQWKKSNGEVLDHEFYDYDQKGENINVVDSPAYRQIIHEMKKLVEAYAQF
ncbi:MAG: sulfatase [Pirellulales bacterium]|nr:sulfatase [Pirellulales bacterium]